MQKRFKMINVIYQKPTENMRNRINARLVNNKKDYLECTLKQSYMSHKVFDNTLVAIRKNKI